MKTECTIYFDYFLKCLSCKLIDSELSDEKVSERSEEKFPQI